MKSSLSFVFAFAIAAVIFVSSAQGTCSDIYPAQGFGDHLCANTINQAPHSSLIELKGNRTSCVLSVAEGVSYHVGNATIQPGRQSVLEIADVGSFVLTLASDCGMDPCYVVDESPRKQLEGASVYISPGIVENQLAYIAVYDCREGQMLSTKAEIYEASPEVVLSLRFVHGIETSLKEISDCVESAAEVSAAKALLSAPTIGVVSVSLQGEPGAQNAGQIVALSASI